MAADLPCDNAGVCMVCGVAAPSEVDLLRCSTCATPWHSPCLSNPPALSEAAIWSCPDCSGDPVAPAAPAAGGELVAAVRAIEADTTLSDAEKARRRQNILAGRSAASAPDDDVDDSAEDDVLNIFGRSFSCAFCMKLLDRPVTVSSSLSLPLYHSRIVPPFSFSSPIHLLLISCIHGSAISSNGFWFRRFISLFYVL
jgi:E3 ubiquitin-protein ligase UHRF1